MDDQIDMIITETMTDGIMIVDMAVEITIVEIIEVAEIAATGTKEGAAVATEVITVDMAGVMAGKEVNKHTTNQKGCYYIVCTLFSSMMISNGLLVGNYPATKRLFCTARCK